MLSNLEVRNRYSILQEEEEEEDDHKTVKHHIPGPPPGLPTTRRKNMITKFANRWCSEGCCKRDQDKLPLPAKVLPDNSWINDRSTDKVTTSRTVPISELIVHRNNQGEAKRVKRTTFQELNAVDTTRTIEMTIDSGAAETVTSNQEIPEVPTVKQSGTERPSSFILAGGEVIENQGETRKHNN